MPRSALKADCVGIIALPAQRPAHILHVAITEQAPLATRADADDGSGPLNAILVMLRERSKHDLTLYKSSTLRRRIERRIAVHGLGSMEAYVAFLRENPQEIDLLFKEMLIGVTSFFRDPAVWQDLKDTMLPALLGRRAADGDGLRAWVVGCSTGEEAYSLAMVFREVIESTPAGSTCTLKIFATDLSADGIAVARKGIYPAGIASAMSPERLARFFSAHGDDFLIDKSIREMVLFAQHDVILDPPFTRLDILSCRNVLIYFTAELQRRLVPLFHYSLRPGGLLMLGGSETVGRWHRLFAPLHPKSRSYRRRENGAETAPIDFPVKPRTSLSIARQEPNLSHSPIYSSNLQALADDLLLRQFSPSAVLVNEAGDILYINGRTGRYLEPAAGKANWNIHVMARPGLRTQLAVALRTALKEKKPAQLQGIRLEDDPLHVLEVTVQAIEAPKSLEGMAMIVFRESAVIPADTVTQDLVRGTSDPALVEELARAQEETRALRREMQASQEALQAANEELQSINEELQSANEELTTSKEEAQSMNEELQTINSELQSRLDELSLAQSDMQNLLNSTDIATLFLDNDLNVRRFTERVTRIIHLRDGDIGRPLSDLASVLIYPQLLDDVKETLRTLAVCEKEISTTEGHWYSVRVMPYRTLANVIQGAVITFVDITASKELESRLRKS
jgi:two-component system CheB/CheR fusion protein